MARNWQCASEKVEASHFAILHHDDVLMPDWHEHVSRILCGATEAERRCVVLGAALVDPRGRLRAPLSFAAGAGSYAPGCLLRLLWRRGCYGIAPSGCIVYETATFRGLGGFPFEAYPNMADVPLHWEMLLKEWLYYDPNILVLLRTGSRDRGSEVYRDELMKGALEVFDGLRGRIGEAVGRSQARLVADYIIPYYASHLAGFRGFSPDASELLSRLRKLTTSGHRARALMSAVLERWRRRWLVLRLAHRVKMAWEATMPGGGHG
jgi:hypothetical protein